MPWRLSEIWKDHTYANGARKGETHRAVPRWSNKRHGYDVYPADDNNLSAAELVTTLDELYTRLGQGQRVRCSVPATDDTPILLGGFQARFTSTS